jgi:hypothetical protein
VIFLIVGLDRDTFARWHQNIRADDAATAERIARKRASRDGVALVVAAAIGPYGNVVDEPSARVARAA